MSALIVVAWLAMLVSLLVGLAVARNRSDDFDGIHEFERWQHAMRTPDLTDQADGSRPPAIPPVGAHRSRGGPVSSSHP